MKREAAQYKRARVRNVVEGAGHRGGRTQNVTKQLMNHADGDVSDTYDGDLAMMDFLFDAERTSAI